MLEKVIIKVEVRNEKRRTKAKRIAAESRGVSSMSIEGEGIAQLVVTGEGIDSYKLVQKLRKKVGHAKIVNPKDVEAKEEKEEEQVKPTESLGAFLTFIARRLLPRDSTRERR